jgi:hypothetical protein
MVTLIWFSNANPTTFVYNPIEALKYAHIKTTTFLNVIGYTNASMNIINSN